MNYATQRWLYPNLFRYSYQRDDPVPFLAADFASGPVLRGAYWALTVTLKQGVEWSDGAQVTAEDLVFTVQTANDLVGGWDSYKDPLDHVEAVGPYTAVLYYTSRPGVAEWPAQAGTMPIVAEHYWAPIVALASSQPDPSAWLYAYDPVGEPTAGPFKRSTWVVGDYVEHVSDPLYYFRGLEITEYANGAYHEMLPGKYEFTAYGEATGTISLQFTYGPYPSAIRYTLYASQDNAVQALRDGDADYVLGGLNISESQVDSLAGEPGIETIVNPANSFVYMAHNMRRSPMDVDEFRRAVATLIDRDYIANVIAYQVQTRTYPIAWSVVPEGNAFWYTPTINIGKELTRGQRIRDAVDLLSSAGFTWTVQPGWDDGAQQVITGQGLHYSGTLVPALELVSPDDMMRSTTAISIAQWLSEAGIETTAVITNFANVINRVWGEQDFDLYMLGWSLGKGPPTHLEAFYHSANDTASSGGSNTSGYNSPTYDALCDQFMAETDMQQARQYAYELQDMLAADLPYIPLYHAMVQEVYRSDSVVYPYTDTLGGIRSWDGLPATVRFVPAQGSIETAGGTLEGPGSSLEFPADTFTGTVTISYTVQPPADSSLSAGFYFDISAVYSDTGQSAQPAPGMTYTITVAYDEQVLAPGVSESSLRLYYWDDDISKWVAEPTSVVDVVVNTITATPDHFSLWAGFGNYALYVPLALKN
jgi:ABC-type transport system substrate-binding protein